MRLYFTGIIFTILLLFTTSVHSGVKTKITVANSKSFPPFSYVDTLGKEKGVLIDYWSAFGEVNNVDVKFMLSQWSESLENVKEGKADVHAGLAKTDKREEFFDFIELPFAMNTSIFIRSSLNIKKIDNINQVIGVNKSSVAKEILQRDYPTLKLKNYKDNIALIKGALNKEIDLFATEDPIVQTYLLKMDALGEFRVLKKINSTTLYAGIRKDNIELINLIEMGMQKVPLHKIEEIQSKWLKFDKKEESFFISMKPFLAILNVILACILGIAILKTRTRGHRWLALLLFLYSTQFLLSWGAFTGNHFILVYMPVLIFPAALFIGSAFLIYSNRVLFDEKKPRLFRHLVFPVVVLMLHTGILIFVPEEMTVAHIRNQTGLHRIYSPATGIVLLVYNTVLFGIAYLQIVQYKKRYKDRNSDDMINNTRWLLNFILLNLAFFLFMAISLVYYAVLNRGIPYSIIEELVAFVIFIFFIYYLIVKPEILPIQKVDDKKVDKKYAKVSLSEDMRKKYAKMLEDYMINEQAFLNEKITIPQISEALDIPQHLLSMTINIEFDKNFYNYINHHRIKYAENLLRNSDEDMTILHIAFQSGFESKTTFNKAFKTFNGMTPTEYRKTHSLKSA